MEHRDLVY